jgi:predicted MPP superfamily phosphohydrolase
MNNCIKLISKVYLIMLIPLVSLLVTSNILIFAEDKQPQQQQQQQSVTIASDVKDPSFFTFFEQIKNATESAIVSDNATESPTDYNFIAAGDWYCNEETKRTINNIIRENPELVITTGDHVKDTPSASCWIEMSKPIKDKMKIAIGNHDAEFANIYKQIVDYHNVKNPFYSYDFMNVHFISLSTEHPFENGSKQYEFIKNDLEKISNNSDIDWIVIHQHKPLYSTKQDKKEAEQLRDTYQELFQQYDVDLVISSHNQYYERTYPIIYNKEYEKATKIEPKPIITNPSRSDYSNKDNGIIFLTVGTAGDELNSVYDKPYFYAFQESKFGFLEIELENNGKRLVGQFHTNDGKVADQFKLNDI